MKIVFTRPTQIVVISFCIVISSLTSSFAADSFEIQNYIEAILGLSRGPLAALSYQNNGTKSGKVKVIHCATDLLRTAHGICAMINHKDDGSYSLGIRGTWVAFDAINFHNDLFPKSINVQDDLIELSLPDEKTINQFTNVSQFFLIPALESTTALYQAIAHEQTAQAQVNRRQAQALCSLARATSIFLNNRQSKAAIVLLIAALSETMLATHASISFSPTNEPGNIFPIDELQHSREASNFGYLQRNNHIVANNTVQNNEELTQIANRHAEELEQLRRNHAAMQAAQEEQEQVERDQRRRDHATAQAAGEEQMRIIIEQNRRALAPVDQRGQELDQRAQELAQRTRENEAEGARMSQEQEARHVQLFEVFRHQHVDLLFG